MEAAHAHDPSDGENVVDFALARARKEALQEGREEENLPSSQSTRRRSADFDAVVGLLEEAQGQVMYGDGLAACLAAFEEDADGVAACAASVLAEWQRGSDIRKPLGVFCKRVAQGQHRRPAPAGDEPTTKGGRDGTTPRAVGEYD